MCCCVLATAVYMFLCIHVAVYMCRCVLWCDVYMCCCVLTVAVHMYFCACMLLCTCVSVYHSVHILLCTCVSVYHSVFLCMCQYVLYCAVYVSVNQDSLLVRVWDS